MVVVILLAAATPAAADCCRVCRSGQACGDSCISAAKTCRKPPGCACQAGASLPLTLAAPPALTPEAKPVIRVIDGDSLEIGGVQIRLEGIDAPELAQTCKLADGKPWPCGEDAKRALARLVKRVPFTCQNNGVDQYGRALAHCTAGGLPVNHEMVKRGWAFAFVKYSSEFVKAEAAARQARRGIWKGPADPPWLWRRGIY